jgi:ABC-2 type transport system ATP-binding protein
MISVRRLWQGWELPDEICTRAVICHSRGHFYPYLSGLEYLQFVGTLRGIAAPLLEEKADTLLDLFALHGLRHSPHGAYSKGMGQKILIIAAVLHNPDVLVFDEPLSGLDVTSALVFRNLVQALARVARGPDAGASQRVDSRLTGTF